MGAQHFLVAVAEGRHWKGLACLQKEAGPRIWSWVRRQEALLPVSVEEVDQDCSDLSLCYGWAMWACR